MIVRLDRTSKSERGEGGRSGFMVIGGMVGVNEKVASRQSPVVSLPDRSAAGSAICGPVPGDAGQVLQPVHASRTGWQFARSGTSLVRQDGDVP